MTCVTHIPVAAGAQPDFHARRALAALKAPHDWRFGQAAGGDGKAGRGGQGHGVVTAIGAGGYLMPTKGT